MTTQQKLWADDIFARQSQVKSHYYTNECNIEYICAVVNRISIFH